MTSVDPVEAAWKGVLAAWTTVTVLERESAEDHRRASVEFAEAQDRLRAAILTSDPRVQALEAVARAARQMAREFDFEFRTDPSRMAVEAALAALQEVPGRGEDEE